MRTKYGTCCATIVIALGLSLFLGCSDENPGEPDPGDSPVYIWNDTADKLMTWFKLAYTNMDIEGYENCLHPDFRFVFINNDSWDHADDVASTENMFAGNPGEDPVGAPRPGVQSIEIIEMTQMLPWETTLSDSPDFPNTQKALYDVNIVFYLDGGEDTITVTSQQFFFTVAVDVDQGDGTTRTRFYLYGQQDIAGEEKVNPSASWGEVKALYRQ